MAFSKTWWFGTEFQLVAFYHIFEEQTAEKKWGGLQWIQTWIFYSSWAENAVQNRLNLNKGRRLLFLLLQNTSGQSSQKSLRNEGLHEKIIGSWWWSNLHSTVYYDILLLLTHQWQLMVYGSYIHMWISNFMNQLVDINFEVCLEWFIHKSNWFSFGVYLSF